MGQSKRGTRCLDPHTLLLIHGGSAAPRIPNGAGDCPCVAPLAGVGFRLPFSFFPAPQRVEEQSKHSAGCLCLGTRSSWAVCRRWSTLRHSFPSAAHNLSHLRQSPTVPAHSQLFQWKMRLIPLICLSPRPTAQGSPGQLFLQS